MGLEIKQNKKGEFSLMSTIVDELLHDKKWISKDEAKKLLIERIMWDAYQEVLRIDRCFPNNGFFIDGLRKNDKEVSSKYFAELDEVNVENGWNLIIEKIREIKSRLGVEVLDVVLAEYEYKDKVWVKKPKVVEPMIAEVVQVAPKVNQNKLFHEWVRETFKWVDNDLKAYMRRAWSASYQANKK